MVPFGDPGLFLDALQCPRVFQTDMRKCQMGHVITLRDSSFVLAAVKVWQSRGRRFDPVQLHHFTQVVTPA
jgi:hypothetical protein